MNEVDKIVEAIRDKKTIKFFYSDEERIVEPYLIGYHATTNKITLRAFFIDGYSSSGTYNTWKLYSTSKIEDVVILDSSFIGDRPEYNPNDKAIAEVIESI